MTMITAIQFRRAQSLARAHGHEWGQVRVVIDRTDTLGPVSQDDPLSERYGAGQISIELPADESSISDAIEGALEPGRSMPGLSFATTHRTGTGRLYWEVLPDGHTVLCVMRPGTALTSLRALDRAVREARREVSELRAAVTPLAGENEWTTDGASPLGQALLAHRLGVEVLRADVVPDGVVIRETTQRYFGDLDAAELRHWITLRDALSTLGVSLPPVREAVRQRLEEWDAICAEVSAAADREAAQDAARPRLEELERATLADPPPPGEIARRRGGNTVPLQAAGDCE